MSRKFEIHDSGMWWAGYFYSGCKGRVKFSILYLFCWFLCKKTFYKTMQNYIKPDLEFIFREHSSHVWNKIIFSPLLMYVVWFCFKIIYSGYFYSGCKGREISPSFTYFVGFYAKPVILSLVCCVPLLIEKVWDCDSRNDGWSVWQ